MKIISYNINGIRASVKLGLDKWIKDFDGDIYCFQEVRCGEELAKDVLFQRKTQLDFFNESEENPLSQYTAIFNCGEIPGYAGTLILSKISPDKIIYNMDEFWRDKEGRTTTIILGKLAVVNAYIPNGNSRLDFKMQYLEALTQFLKKLSKDYDVVCVGDFNIAHNEIDLTNPKECRNKSVFLPIEREAFGKLLDAGMLDTFRFLNPTKVDYSWRSYRSRQDDSYNSWKYRIDYILASNSLKDRLIKSEILDLVYSDHLPVVAEIK